MPPESWNGYDFATRSGSASPAAARICGDPPLRLLLPDPQVAGQDLRHLVTDAITGFRPATGSWKIIEICRPRTIRNCVIGAAQNSDP